ncbi:histidine phosphatase family protein [Streptomyces sp. NPDC101115]|uniref:histidine phosphatase family protein n=1 Tax=Streptomyces sp. NPDC101115 TaxID=3366106 RepID=UPI0038190A28
MRHGAYEGHRPGYHAPHEATLTQEGRDQVRRSLPLPEGITAIVTSPIPRARQTATLVSHLTGLPIVATSGLLAEWRAPSIVRPHCRDLPTGLPRLASPTPCQPLPTLRRRRKPHRPPHPRPPLRRLPPPDRRPPRPPSGRLPHPPPRHPHPPLRRPRRLHHRRKNPMAVRRAPSSARPSTSGT